ncbi:MAG: hypothetical protein MUC29_14875 [Pyrinomonadaceae bacterium]|jgi:GH25 family lysozyme M1 (1,4-beta-N-acetylmuramidase)|nr:hypothetical protein [Pyrinomonadaceae bacterium]
MQEHKLNGNGKVENLPNAKDYKPTENPPKKIKELREATREAMQALQFEIEKYGKKPDFRH